MADHLEAGRAPAHTHLRASSQVSAFLLGTPPPPPQPLFALLLCHLSPFVVVTWVPLWVAVILTKHLSMQVIVCLYNHPGEVGIITLSL